ncbi:hypothetical protein JQ634_21725 [Bradyrhizobium sp. AUGA SZCCT0240]|uniref:hypothetical protein n=1 Tax=unclassified Bradyrhizobium TaxID=2631580 RepID=UPI001BA92013|nr:MULTISPECIES: hypothetical protein [unclassified Bradyrhizobium]MBR1195814.1 hypothetical protein [Bradyrhizobium sp. AUGA SZCCT0158]MBR1240213.1 hypothetical protein [Bradyrhizobium sp. AUGA SZCCT0274]MBR1256313.1 hypothetical protein [Bradyrhizobium sp. AUGA SZCCT0240]
MADRENELKDVVDALVKSASQYIDKQEEDANPYTQAAREKEEDEVRKGAVEDARMVAKILISQGGDAAREALGFPPPNPLEQQKLRETILLNPERAAMGLNSVILEIDDDADHGVAGSHYWVAANLYLPALVGIDALPLERE